VKKPAAAPAAGDGKPAGTEVRPPTTEVKLAPDTVKPAAHEVKPAAHEVKPAATDGKPVAAPRPAAAAVSGGDMAAIKTAMISIDKKIAGTDVNIVKIAKAVEAIAADGLKRQKAYDELYAEMKDYKADFVYTSQKPLYMELLLLFDSIHRALKKLDEDKAEVVSRADIRDTVTKLKEELLEILYRHDIEPVALVPPAKLDVEKQKPIKRIDTADPAEDKLVTEVIREGFMRGDVVLRPQEVVVKRHGAAAQGSSGEKSEKDKSQGAALSGADASSHERRES
jgi:molecular chaperone GrpE (heat shock protein)